MQVKIVLKHDNWAKAIKELRQLTGMGLKQAVDLIPSSVSWGDSFEVDTLGSFNQSEYHQFKITALEKQKVTDELKSLICKAVWNDEIVLAQDLMIALDRANSR